MLSNIVTGSSDNSVSWIYQYHFFCSEKDFVSLFLCTVNENNNILVEKIRTFVVTEFVKLSDEPIIGMQQSWFQEYEKL